MFNTKNLTAAFAAVVVAGACAKGYITRTKTETAVAEAINDFRSVEFIAFNRAQDVSTERMLAGNYDNMTNEQVVEEFAVLYANFLTQ